MIIRDPKTGRIISAKRLFVFNPMRECLCGCGTIFPSRSKRCVQQFYIHGHNNPGGRFKKGLIPHNWKGKTIDRGYVKIAGHYEHPRNHQGRVFEHILIMEECLGRYLKQNEVVHHINGNKQDNRLENLEVMTRSQHKSMHTKLDWMNGKFNHLVTAGMLFKTKPR